MRTGKRECALSLSCCAGVENAIDFPFDAIGVSFARPLACLDKDAFSSSTVVPLMFLFEFVTSTIGFPGASPCSAGP